MLNEVKHLAIEKNFIRESEIIFASQILRFTQDDKL